MKYFLTLLLFTSCATKQAPKKSPTEKKASLYYNQGTANLISKDYTKALKNLTMANKLIPNNSKTLNNLGMAYYLKKNPTTAINYIKKAIEVDKKNSDAKINLATIYMNLGKNSQAKAIYQGVLKDLMYEDQYKTYYNLGILSLKDKQIHKAKEFFAQSLTSNENYCPAHFQLGLISYRSGRYKKAAEQFKSSGMGTCYNNPEPFLMKAQAELKSGDLFKSRNTFESIVERFPRSKQALIAKEKLMKIDQSPKQRRDSIEYLGKRINLKDEVNTPNF